MYAGERPSDYCRSLQSSAARVVVALDFGTTFSGFAYARSSQPNDIFNFFDWPHANKVGAKPYCKTQTSLFYTTTPSSSPTSASVRHDDGDGLRFELKDWGWSALHEFTQSSQASKSQSNRPCMQDAALIHPSPLLESYNGGTHLLAFPRGLSRAVGFFATKFKLYLAPEESTGMRLQLPGDLTVERMVSDYLRCLSNFIVSELQVRYGKHFNMTDVQWCLTVPAIWDERAKQIMKNCAEKAGMVTGAECPPSEGKLASPYPLGIVLEPEAASVYCQQKAKYLGFEEGDKLLVADIGGGTIDLVVHEKADNDPESMRVHEVIASYGDIGGGTFVDSSFFHFLSRKMGCLKDFCQKHASIGINMFGWWQGVKMGFDGEGGAVMPLPRKLSEAWERYDKEHGIEQHADEEYYDEVRLSEAEIRSIFEPEVNKIISLIEREIEGVRLLMVVGGFAASPYLRKCIQDKFSRRVEEIIIPDEPGSAICHGAVQLQLRNDTILSRIAKVTYGVSISRMAKLGDPRQHIFIDDDGRKMCKSFFSIFVRAGDRVPLNSLVQNSYWPVYRNQKDVRFDLYSSSKRNPEFITEPEAVKEGSFEVDIREGMVLDIEDREVEVSMCFGASLIQVSATRVNFGSGNVERAAPVKFLAE